MHWFMQKKSYKINMSFFEKAELVILRIVVFIAFLVDTYLFVSYEIQKLFH